MARILIVDDEADIRDFTRKYLEKRGYEAIAVQSALLGLRLLSKESFDVLVSDINMPQMDGVEFAARAKRLHPDLVILLLTGHGSLDTAQEAIKIGIHDYLTKPVELDKLQGSIDEGLSRVAQKKKGLEYYQKLEAELSEDKNRLDSMKDELLTLINHELRTPVAIISDGFSLLRDTMQLPTGEKMQTLSDEQKKRLFENIEKGRRRLINIIDDLNYYLNLSKGQVHLATGRVNLKDFLGDSFETLKHFVRERKAVLKGDFASTERFPADVCKERMLDVLERLIHNAAYHNPEGTEITLRLGTVKRKTDSEQEINFTTIEVCDNGQGIESKLLGSIFSPFSAGDIAHHSKGIGLGLCICKKIVELHGGQLRLDSEEGKGTRVTIELPDVA